MRSGLPSLIRHQISAKARVLRNTGLLPCVRGEPLGEPKIAPDEHGRQACADKPADDSATGRAAMRAAAGMTGADGRCGSDRCIRARSRRIRFRTVGVQPGGRSRSVNCRRRAMNAPARVSPPARIARASARSGIGALEPRLARGGTEVDIGSNASAGLAAGKHFPPRCASAPATSRPAARPPAESARRHVEPTRCRENRSPWNRPITRGFIFTT